MKTVIVGCGNIGVKRINAIQNIPEIEIVGLAEIDEQQIQFLNDNYTFPVTKDYTDYLNDKSIEAFIVSATTHLSLKIIEDALNAGKHVLCEKPLGYKLEQTVHITKLANDKSLVLHIGFNIRYDEGLLQAKQLIEDGKIGIPYFYKCTYVNGSVVTNNNKVGALLDMGIHNLYLAKMFMGEFEPIACSLQNFEYEIEDLDDNGFILFKNNNFVGNTHFSLCRWKNDFELEVTGSTGSVIVQSLTKWGTQVMLYHERVFPSGVPIESRFEYNRDDTWEKECREFYERVIKNDLAKNNEAVEMMEIAEYIKKHTLTKI